MTGSPVPTWKPKPRQTARNVEAISAISNFQSPSRTRDDVILSVTTCAPCRRPGNFADRPSITDLCHPPLPRAFPLFDRAAGFPSPRPRTAAAVARRGGQGRFRCSCALTAPSTMARSFGRVEWTATAMFIAGVVCLSTAPREGWSPAWAETLSAHRNDGQGLRSGAVPRPTTARPRAIRAAARPTSTCFHLASEDATFTAPHWRADCHRAVEQDDRDRGGERMTRRPSSRSATTQSGFCDAVLTEAWWNGLTASERKAWNERLAAQDLQPRADAAMALHYVDMFWAAVRRHHQYQAKLVAEKTRLTRCGTTALG